MDVTDRQSIEEAVELVSKAEGKLHVLVNKFVLRDALTMYRR